eukprot:TRINITY_DN1597_c0_g1_i2.p1 TRINITY_DN1597_c0_g1~~TRINITY_DN1597_c0_g1_i2.p1  ORF type:complete len:356 (+),score=137.39 TRINITY_DN1597_c0_g1_i2:77-1144(+)
MLAAALTAMPAVAGITPPNTSLATIPVVYFGGINATRPAENIAMLAKMRAVGIEKWEGPCWSDCLYNGQNCGPTCGVEQYMVGTLKRVKQANPKVSTFFYWNTLLDFAFYGESAKIPKVVDSNTKKDLVLRNDNGLPNVYVFDYAKEAGRDGWYNFVVNLTKTGYVDGTFADKYGVYAHQNGTSSDWKICNHWCGGVTAEEGQAWNAGKNATVEKTKKFFWDQKGIFFHGTTEFVHSPRNEPETLIKSVKKTLSKYLYAWVYVAGDQEWGSDPTDVDSECDEDSVIAFLLAVEPGAFLECNGWADEFAYSLGDATAPAAQHGDVWTRSFTSGTNVTWNTKTKSGKINWASRVAVL